MSGNRKMNVALGKNNKYGVDGIKREGYYEH